MATPTKTLYQLTLPLAIETFFLTMVGILNTYMLSQSSDIAVGAVGTSASLISIFLISFNIIAIGSLTVMTQYIGSGQPEVAVKTAKIGITISLFIGIIFSFIVYFYADFLLDLLGVNSDLRSLAITYTRILGGSLFLYSTTPVFAHLSRSFGLTKWPLLGTIASNLANLTIHFLFVYGAFGFPQLGVIGVGIGVIFARSFNLLVNIIGANLVVPKKLTKSLISVRTLIHAMLKMGLPSAAENILYSIAIATVVGFINHVSGAAVITRTYLANIIPFVYIITAAIGGATSLLVGWYIGQKNTILAYQSTLKSASRAIFVSGFVSLLLVFFGPSIMHIFTQDPLIIELSQTIFIINLFLELGRALNITIGAALKAAGDATYTLIIGLFSMIFVLIGGSWFFGLYLGFGLAGIWTALMLDEVGRSILMLLRWFSRRWTTKSIVQKTLNEVVK